MANLLTAIRLLLIAPVVMVIADAERYADWLLLLLVIVAIASDYFDGKVARALNTASPRGMLFDHGTDFLFVTTALFALSTTGLGSLLLPALIVVAFSQYVFDSYFLFKDKQLRMSFLGRWNGIFYFAPLVLVAVARLFASSSQDFLNDLTVYVSYLLILSTLASIADRAMAPLRERDS